MLFPVVKRLRDNGGVCMSVSLLLLLSLLIVSSLLFLKFKDENGHRNMQASILGYSSRNNNNKDGDNDHRRFVQRVP